MPKALKIKVHSVFAISQERVDEVDVLYADKHESLLQIDSIVFERFNEACPKYPVKLAMSL